jgi:ADP-heptose:LPS heptosyltransferase
MILVRNNSRVVFEETWKQKKYRIAPGASCALPDDMAFKWFGVKREGVRIVFSKNGLGEFSKKYKGAAFIFTALKPARKNKKAGTCFIRIGGIGDMVMLSSAIKQYKREHQKEKIVLATHPMNYDLFRDVDYIDEIIDVYEADGLAFDKTIDLRFAVEPPSILNGKMDWKSYTTKDRSDLFDKLVGVKSKKDFPIYVSPAAITEMKKRIQWKPNEVIVGLNPLATSLVRSLPFEYIKPLVNELLDTCTSKVVLFGKTDDQSAKLAEISHPFMFNLMDKTNVMEMAALISIMTVVIAPDTAAMHIAGALKTPCLALFGNIDPATRVKYYPSVTPFYPVKELDCVPCFDRPEDGAYICHDLKCGICMRLLTPKRITAKVKELLNA